MANSLRIEAKPFEKSFCMNARHHIQRLIGIVIEIIRMSYIVVFSRSGVPQVDRYMLTDTNLFLLEPG